MTFADTPDSLRLRLNVHQRNRAHWLAIGRTEQEWWDWRDELQRRLTMLSDAPPSGAAHTPAAAPPRQEHRDDRGRSPSTPEQLPSVF